MMTNNIFITKLALRILAIACLLVSPLSLMAEKIEVDGICYEITPAYIARVVSGGNYSGKVVIPSHVTYKGRSCEVIAIDDYAFHECKELTSIEMPDGVLTIGSCVFYGSGLQSVVFGKNVRSIGEGSFGFCNNLVSIALPNSIKKVEVGLFADCQSLKFVSWGSGVTSIEERAFEGCTSLEAITIPKNIYTISRMAFIGCSNLKTLTFEYSDGYDLRIKKGIYNYFNNTVFSGCPIETVNLNRNITFEGNISPFEDIKSLKNVVIGDDLTTIGECMFRGCSNLSSVSFGKKIQEIGCCAFFNCKSLTSVDFPESLLTISEYAFYGCSGLTSLTIGTDNNDFYYYSNYFVRNHAFDSCVGLKSLNIKNVGFIGEYAFSNCTAIEEIRTRSENPPSIYSTSFDEETVRNATLHVPVPSFSQQSKYKTVVHWKDFFHIVVDLPSGINVIDNKTEDAGCIYDMQGRKVTMPKKNGIYIKNGKKFVVH